MAFNIRKSTLLPLNFSEIPFPKPDIEFEMPLPISTISVLMALLIAFTPAKSDTLVFLA